MKGWIEGQGFKTYKGYNGMEFTISKKDRDRMLKGLHHYNKTGELYGKNKGFTDKVLRDATKIRNKNRVVAEREAMKEAQEKRQQKTRLSVGKNNIIFQIRKLVDGVDKTKLENKKMSADLKQITALFVEGVDSLWDDFMKQYDEIIRTELPRVYHEYGEKVVDAILDSAHDSSYVTDDDMMEIYERVYGQIIEGRVKSDAEIGRLVDSLLNSYTSKKK